MDHGKEGVDSRPLNGSQPGQRTRPIGLWLILALTLVAAGSILIPTLPALGSLISGLGQAGAWSPLYLLFIAVLAMAAAVGFGLVVLAWHMYRGSRVARGVMLVFLGTVALQSLFGGQGLTTSSGPPPWLVVLVLAIAVYILAFDSSVRAFFRSTDERPVSVVVASTLVGFLGACLFLVGAVLVALVPWLGVALIAMAVALFFLIARLRRGSSGARAAVTALMVIYGALALVQHDTLGSMLWPLGLAGGVLSFLWLPADARTHFLAPLPAHGGGDATERPAQAGSGADAGTNQLDGGAAATVASSPGYGKPPKSMWAWGAPAIGVVILLGLSALVLNKPAAPKSGVSAAVAQGASATADASTQTPASVANAPQTIHGGMATWTIDGTDGQGYSAEVTLALDAPMKASNAATSSVGRAVGACTFNSDTDGVIPVHLQETNTTTGFSSILGVELDQANGGSAVPGQIQIGSDVKYSSGEECNGSDSGVKVFGEQWNDAVLPGAAATDTFYLVIYNYYSPANPNGDVSGLLQVNLSPVITFVSGNTTDARRATSIHVTTAGSAPFNLSVPYAP